MWPYLVKLVVLKDWMAGLGGVLSKSDKPSIIIIIIIIIIK